MSPGYYHSGLWLLMRLETPHVRLNIAVILEPKSNELFTRVLKN